MRGMKTLAGFGVAAMIGLGGPALAAKPSFNCAKASTAVEKLLCADDRLAAADRAEMELLHASNASTFHRAGTT